MSIYTDYNAQQSADNSYFSVASVVARVSEYISDESSLVLLEEALKEYYIPAFTVDVTANIITVGIYPIYGEASTIQLSRTPGSEPIVSSGVPPVSASQEVGQYEKIAPLAEISPVSVDPSIHTDSVIKRPIGFDLQDENNTNWHSHYFNVEPIENLLISQCPVVSADQDSNILVENQTRLQVICDIIASKISDFDPEIRETLVNTYDSWESKVLKVQELLSTISAQQAQLLTIVDEDSIKENHLQKHPDATWTSNTNEFGSILTSIKDSLGGEKFLTFPETSEKPYEWWEYGTNSDIRSLVENPHNTYNDSYFSTSRLFQKQIGHHFGFEEKLLPNEATYEDYGVYSSTGQKATSFYISHYEALAYRKLLKEYIAANTSMALGKDSLTTAAVGEIDSNTLKSWYAEEIDALLLEKDSPGSALAWIQNFNEVLENMQKTLKLDISGGSSLLYHQCILKAMDELVDSGIDLAGYLGTENGDPGADTWLDLVGADYVQGTGKTGVFPNLSRQQRQDNEDGSDNHPEGQTLSDNRYIDYSILIRLLYSCNIDDLKLEFSAQEDGVIDFLVNQLLNGGDISTRSNASLFCVGDVVRNIGGLSCNPIVPDRDRSDYMSVPANSDGDMIIQDDRMAPLYFKGREDYLPRSTSSYGAPVNAESIMGVNWQKVNYDGSYQKASGWTSGGNKGSGYSSKYGPVYFHTVTETVLDDYHLETNREGLAKYDERRVYKGNGKSGFQINNFWSGNRHIMPLPDGTIEIKEAFKDWLNNNVANYNTQSDWFDPIQGISRDQGCHVVPTGVLTGALVWTYFWKDPTTGQYERMHADRLYRGSPYFVEATNQVLYTNEPLGFDTPAAPKHPMFKWGWSTGPSTYRGPLSWDYHEEFTAEPWSEGQNNSNREYEANGESNEDIWFLYKVGYGTVWPYTGGEWRMQEGSVGATARDATKYGENEPITDWIFPLEWMAMKYSASDDPGPGPTNTQYIPERYLSDAISAKTDLEEQKDFFLWKGGGLLRFWGILEGIWKRLYRRTHEILIDSLNEMCDGSVDYSIIDNLDETCAEYWVRSLDQIVEMIRDEELDLDQNLRVGYDGNVILVSPDYHNWTKWAQYSKRMEGQSAIDRYNAVLGKEYAIFKSKISDVPSIRVAPPNDVTGKGRQVQWTDLFPLEALRSQSNPNYTGGFGLPRQYIVAYPPSYVRDPLVFQEAEMKLESIRAKNVSTPYGTSREPASSRWIHSYNGFLRIANFLDNIKEPIETFTQFLEDLIVSDELKEVYQEGLVTSDDISKSGKILPLIAENFEKYRSDPNGIGRHWLSLKDNSLMKNILSPPNGDISPFNDAGDNHGYFLCCIGLNEDFVQWTLTNAPARKYFIDIDFVTDGWTEGSTTVDQSEFGIHMPTHSGGTPSLVRCAICLQGGSLYGAAQTNPTKALTVSELSNSMDGLHTWLHLVKGFNMDESTFVDDYAQIYSEFLQTNEEGHFPWAASDFQNDKAVGEVESIYNLSALLFPKNFFMQVIKPREFRKVIPVIVKVPKTSGMFQGNIKFKIFIQDLQANPNIWV